jgi:hypothetical protein
MIYLLGGAPRTGKSILAQRVAGRIGAGWVSTDLLLELLRAKKVEGIKTRWDASAGAIRADAEWFFPCLERFVWGASSLAQDYVIEGVDFLPEHVLRLSARFPLRAAFLGCSSMTLAQFDLYPGRSRGYSDLPEAMRRQIVEDVPLWSEFIRQECERTGQPYVDMSGDFAQRMEEAEALLTTRV